MISQRTVDIRFVKDDLAADPDADLSGYSRDDDSVSYPEPHNLKLSFDTSLDKAEPAAETLQDLRNLYDGMYSSSSESTGSLKGLIYVPVLGRYFCKQSSSSEEISLGTDCFAYYRELNMEPEEISADNVFLPMVKAGTRYMPYIGNRIHRYLDVAKSDEESKQSLQFCYAHFYTRAATPISPEENWFSGSPYSYLENGRQIVGVSSIHNSYPALTPEGMNYFWRDYETLLVNGAPEIEVTLDIPINKLQLINRFTPKIYKGAKVMIKSLSYTIDDSGTASTKAVLWVMSKHDDDITIPSAISFGTAYSWKLVSTKEANWPANADLLIQISDGLEDYTSADAPESKPMSAGMIVKKRSRWTLFILAPETFMVTWEEYFISV